MTLFSEKMERIKDISEKREISLKIYNNDVQRFDSTGKDMLFYLFFDA